MNRKISLSIEDIYIKYAGEAFGATGSHNALTLRMIFGSAWDGTAKTAYFTDALGSASVSIVLGLDKLVGGAYEVDVPSEALKYAGEATVTIKGVLTSGDTTTKAITTAAGHFRVLDSELPESVGNAGTITPSDKEQLQAEIDGLKNLFTTTKTAAETAAANAKVSETNAKTSETAASGSASSAEASKTAAAESAATATAQASAADASAAKAAVSQKATQTAETNAKASEKAAAASQASAETASASAQNSAAAAAKSAQAAQGAASTATNAASSANQSATAASGSASQAQASAAAAAQSAASVDGINKTAQSWAVGGTGTRPGEDTDNAKYWAEQAQAVAGGDFATKNEAQGYVTTHNRSADAHADIREALNGKEASGTAAEAVAAHNTDATAHADIREAVSKAGKPFIIEGTLTFTDGTGTVSGITTTKDEILAAIEAGKDVNLRLSWDYDGDPRHANLAYCRRSTSYVLNMELFQFGCTVGDFCIGVTLAYTESGLQTIYEEREVISCSDDAPSAPGIASAGTSSMAARADHVHPSERPKATQVTLTAAGWDSSTKKQTVTVSGVLADTSKQVIWVAFASEAALDAYMDAGIVPVAQGANTVTFRADKVPTADISVTVLMQGVLT